MCKEKDYEVDDFYQPEKIMAAAVLFIDVPISARRHSECYKIILKINGGMIPGDSAKRESQGFVTTHGRYISREEAFKIAKRENQIYHKAFNNDTEGTLTSEDLW